MAARMGSPGGGDMERTRARRGSAWSEAGILLPIAVALVLWGALVYAVASPLGATLARLDAPPDAALLACGTPPDALASAPPRSDDAACP